MSANRFPNLPEPNIKEPDYDGDLARIKERYFKKTGHYPQTNDAETFVLEEIAYEKNEVVDLINYESKQNLMAFADDERLDYIGDLTETPRLDASAALTVMQFT